MAESNSARAGWLFADLMLVLAIVGFGVGVADNPFADEASSADDAPTLEITAGCSGARAVEVDLLIDDRESGAGPRDYTVDAGAAPVKLGTVQSGGYFIAEFLLPAVPANPDESLALEVRNERSREFRTVTDLPDCVAPPQLSVEVSCTESGSVVIDYSVQNDSAASSGADYTLDLDGTTIASGTVPSNERLASSTELALPSTAAQSIRLAAFQGGMQTAEFATAYSCPCSAEGISKDPMEFTVQLDIAAFDRNTDAENNRLRAIVLDELRALDIEDSEVGFVLGFGHGNDRNRFRQMVRDFSDRILASLPTFQSTTFRSFSYEDRRNGLMELELYLYNVC